MKMKGLVIRDISVRSAQQASNEDVDHESQQEIGQSSTVNPSNAPNQGILYISNIMFVIMVNIV